MGNSFYSFYFMFFVLTAARSTHAQSSEKIGLSNDTYESFVTRLFHNYNKMNYPTQTKGEHFTPTVMVNVSLYVASLSEIDIKRMDYLIDIYLTQSWYDMRLSHSGIGKNVTLYGENVKKVWTPHIYFPSEKMTYSSLTSFVKISPDGNVMFNQRLKMRLSCMMHLEWYPVDTQDCTILILPYSQTEQKVQLKWASPKPVTLRPEVMESAEFENPTVLHDTTNILFGDNHSNSNVSALSIKFVFSRHFGINILKIYLPLVCIVFVAYTSCFISLAAVPGRASIGVITVLAVVINNEGLQSKLASVAYLKAIDVFVIGALITVIISYSEFVMAHYLEVHHTGKKSNGHLLCDNRDESNARQWNRRFSWNRLTGKHLDKFTRIVLPMMFTIFNIVYWVYLLVKRSSQIKNAIDEHH